MSLWYQIDTNFIPYDFHMRKWWPMSLRLNATQRRQLARLSEKLQIKKQEVLRQSLAQMAEREGVSGKPEGRG